MVSGLSRSYSHGASQSPLTGSTVGAILQAAEEQWPEVDALIVPHQNIRWTWRKLNDEVNHFAAGLLTLGLNPGDRIGMLSQNRYEWVVVQFASARAGLILVNINPAYRVGELEYALSQSGCRALVLAPKFKSSHYIEMLRELAPSIDSSRPGELNEGRLPDLKTLVTLGDKRHKGCFCFSDVADRTTEEDYRKLQEISDQLDFDDPINIQFTSGTTGTPKAATLTHHNIVNNAWVSAEVMQLTSQDRLCIPVPMYHCFGMVLGTLLCATHGITIVLPSAGFDAQAMLDAIDNEQCTAVHGVPTMFISALEAPNFSKRSLHSLRTGIMAGAPCPVELMRRVMDEMHLSEITIAYGMTETGPLSTQTLIDDPVELRTNTVGRALPHTEIKLVDALGHIVPLDTPGELCTRGYAVMRGYWGDPERTAKEIDAAHWIKSGDIATMDQAGYVRIVGRMKDMLIRGGENIYPREIEAFLYNHPDIEQIEVFGVPDLRLGEEVAAWIKLKPGHSSSPELIRDYCKGKLAHFKIPRHIRFVEDFPMTATGKVQKYVMRDHMTSELQSLNGAQK